MDNNVYMNTVLENKLILRNNPNFLTWNSKGDELSGNLIRIFFYIFL